ncbi:amidohydrolase family protein [Actinomadura syzygii]|uniref:Amidohydrolase family protein n=1 Tax=Actinomadura syzygii TaxID=1427538 RepID=A0A5D0UHN5_9ACTN|nr:amidohydrolase family protein [Actinomadura syzygii]TYC17577.1 amidohydrolase family protein [Actinomadura syzygii]
MANGRRTLIRGGHLVTMDDTLGDLPSGDLLIDDDVIAAVVAAGAAGDADAVIDASGMIVLPGLVDTHIHLWQTVLRGMASELWTGEYFERVLPYRARFRPDDVYAGGYVGGLELLSNGVTTALDFCHCIVSPGHADAAVAGLVAAGLRGVHGYSLRAKPPGHFTTHDQRSADAVRLNGEIAARGKGRVGLMLALSDLETVDVPTCAREVAQARELGLRMTIHSNFPGQVTAMHEAGLLGPNLLLVHCNVVTDRELDMLAHAGAAISVTPGVEIGLGSPFTVLGRAIRRGVRIGWGCDIPSFTNSDLIAQMRLAHQVQNFLDGAAERAEGRSGRRPGVPTLTARDVLRHGTIEGARALGLDDRIGSLTPGKQADVVLLRAPEFGTSLCDPAAHLLLQSGVQDVDTVLVAGRVRKRGGRLTGVDPGFLTALVDRARSHVLAAEPPPD